MRLGIMQPYYFPYLGHFSLMAHCDSWLIFDVPQYTPKSWMTRNRLVNREGEPTYFSVQLENSSRNQCVLDVRIHSLLQARNDLLGKFSIYRKKAPHYRAVTELIEEVFDSTTSTSLVDLNEASLQAVCRVLGIDLEFRRVSELNLDFSGVRAPGEWAPIIADQYGAEEYINPIGGRGLFRSEDFTARSMSLSFLEWTAPTYATPGLTFQADLSVLDALAWNEPLAVRSMLMDFGSVVPALTPMSVR